MSTTLQLFLGIFAVLGFASAVALTLRYTVAKGQPHAVIDNLNARVNAWWVMVAAIAGAFVFGRAGVMLLFAFVSWHALREVVTLLPTRRADHVALVVRVVEQRLADRVDAVAQHALPLEGQRGQRKAALVVLARHQAVDAVGREQLAPARQVLGAAAVHRRRIVGIQLHQRQEMLGARAHHCGRSITSRQ